jgi:hypothetical protein
MTMSMSSIGFAWRSGTAVLPTCSMRKIDAPRELV